MTRRVVHVVRSAGFAGVERYVSEAANALHERGWRVDVIGGEAARMTTALRPGVRFTPASTTAAAAAALVSLGRVPLVHAHMTAAEVAAVLTRPRTRATVISTRHFAQRRGSTPLIRVVMRGVVRSVARELAISQFVASQVEGEPTVVLNGVPGEDHAALGRHVLVMQRLEVEKDTRTAVLAFAASGLAQRGWTLRIAGRGREHARLVELAEQQGVGDQVSFLGFVEDPSALRHEGGIFLATAPREPFGLAVAEAMAAGLAVVAAEGGAHRETLGESGTYFPVHDVDACAAALRALAAAPERRAAMGAAARRRQQQHLTIERHVDALERVYAEACR